MDLKKAFDVAKLPIVVLLVLAVLGLIVAFLGIPVLGEILFLITVVAVCWFGYRAVAEFKLDLPTAVVSTVLAVFISSIFQTAVYTLSILSDPSLYLETDTYYATLSADEQADYTSLYIVGYIVGLLFLVGVDIIGGTILAAIGAWVASQKTSTQKEEKPRKK